MKKTIDSARPKTIRDMLDNMDILLDRSIWKYLGKSIQIKVKPAGENRVLTGGYVARHCPELLDEELEKYNQFTD